MIHIPTDNCVKRLCPSLLICLRTSDGEWAPSLRALRSIIQTYSNIVKQHTGYQIHINYQGLMILTRHLHLKWWTPYTETLFKSITSHKKKLIVHEKWLWATDCYIYIYMPLNQHPLKLPLHLSWWRWKPPLCSSQCNYTYSSKISAMVPSKGHTDHPCCLT